MLFVAVGVFALWRDFVRIDGRERRRLGAVDTRTGQVTSWHPRLGVRHGAGLAVHALLVGHGVLYAGEAFRTVDGKVRRNLAALRLSSGRPTSFDARLPISYKDVAGSYGVEQTPVLALALRDHALYIGGDEYFADLQSSLRAADARTGSELPWHVHVTGQGRALAVSSTSVVAGGCRLQYQLGGGPLAPLVLSGVLGAFSRRDGTVLGSPANQVTHGPCGRQGANMSALSRRGDHLYVGGEFRMMGGRQRRGLAAVDVRGRLLAWAPALPAGQWAVGLSAAGATVFARLRSPNGMVNGLRAYSATSGRSTGLSWIPLPDTTIDALAATPTTLYVGGTQAQKRSARVISVPFVGALDARTGRDLALPICMRGGEVPQVEALAVSDKLLYIGGEFTHIGNARRRNFAAVRLSDMRLNAIAPDPEFTVSSMAVGAHAVYLADQGIVTVDTSAAPAARIHLGADDYARLLASARGRLYVAGV
jgi:hypothetical protein